MSEEKKLPTVGEAQAIVQEARKRARELCEKEIRMVEAKYGLKLVARPILLGDGRLSAVMELVDAPRD